MTLLRNGVFNLAGALLPAVALFITIPLIITRLGAEAYGALVLVTSIVGYFGVIDINATAGTVKYVAEHQARGDDRQVSQVVTAAAVLHLCVGLLGAAVLYLGAGALVTDVFRVEPHWRAEAEATLRWSAAAFVVGQAQALLNSLPQALQRYDIVGRLDALFGTLVPVATLGVVAAGGSLVEIVQVRLLVSVGHAALLWRASRALLPGLNWSRPGPGTAGRLLHFSAYSWLQRLASLTSQNADKLLVGAQQSMAALAAYGIPLTLCSRVFGLLYRLLQAVFPLASALQALGQMEQLRRSSVMLQRYTLYLGVCACLLCAGFARELLHYWLQGRLPETSAVVLVLVAFTLLVDSATNVPSLVNDGLGRPHLTAAASMLRAGLGVAAAAVSLALGDIVTLALSQLLVSAGVAAGFLWAVHRHSLPWRWRDVAGPVYGLNAAVLVAGTALLAWRWHAPVLAPAAFAAAAALSATALAAVGWFAVLEPVHRRRALGWLGRRPLPR
jgi:O-antigen/teichoic acid export membrane protein